jgi:hypothetical protein
MKTKNRKMVTGEVETENRDLSEILTGRKANKFAKYASRAAYRSALFDMSHIEIMEEALRIGVAPSSEKEFCRNHCLSAWDGAHKNRKVTLAGEGKQTLDSILEAAK